MQVNPSIILAGQTPDIMGNFSRGMDVRRQRNALATQEGLADLYRTQGAQILAGEQEALNALAGFDPNAALGVQQTRLGMEATRHGMQMDEASLAIRQEELAMARENAKLRGMEFAAQMDAQTAAASAAAIEKAIAMGSQAQTPEQWDAVMRQLGEDGAQFVGQFENRDMIIAGALGLSEALKMRQQPEATAAQRDYKFYADQETAAGRTPLSFNDWSLQGKKAGAVNVTVGMPGQEPPAGDALRASMSDADTMLSLIRGIKSNAALPRVTGAIEGGGGNDVDQLHAGQRMWYGDDGLALIQAIGQLQGNAWFAARELLKGGGPITDYESRKAEGAIARLSRAQGTEQFVDALTDLEQAILDGMAKLKAAQGGQSAPAPGGAPPSALSDEELLRMYGGE